MVIEDFEDQNTDKNQNSFTYDMAESMDFHRLTSPHIKKLARSDSPRFSPPPKNPFNKDYQKAMKEYEIVFYENKEKER